MLRHTLCCKALSLGRTAVSTHAGALQCLGAVRFKSKLRFFDNLIPEDDPELKQKKELERKVIKEKMKDSKFAQMFKAEKDKRIIATQDVVVPAAENIFPELEVTAFRQGRDLEEIHLPTVFAAAPVTLVSLAFQAVGQGQLLQWQPDFIRAMNPIPAGMQSDGRVAMLNLIYLDSWFFKLMPNLIANSSRKALDPALRQLSGIHIQSSQQKTDYFCERLNVHNRVMGHLFLVDKWGYVRWRSHSLPAPGEVQGLIAAAQTLQKA